jgi:hypothetical protein
MAQKTGLAKPSHRFYDQLRPTWRCWSRKKFSLGCAIVEVGLMDTYVRAMQERLKAKKNRLQPSVFTGFGEGD